jgi:hypothetical protein
MKLSIRGRQRFVNRFCRKTNLRVCAVIARGRLFALVGMFVLGAIFPCSFFYGQELAMQAAVMLPDAPEPVASTEIAPSQTAGQSSVPNAAPGSLQVFKIGPWRDPKSLDLSMPVVPLSIGEKLTLSFHEQLTPFALASTVFAASWEQLVNSNPKYGSNGTAFAQRVGAAALRQTSQAVFSDGVYASAFRQDPRYYRMAEGPLGKRILYAATRTFRSRSDSGQPAINYSLLFGHATAQALTLTYYPDRSQSGRVALTGFAWSLLGSMLGNQYHEFWPDILQAVFQTPPAGPRPASLPAGTRQIPRH